MERRPPRIGHRKSRKGCAQCKRRHVKCNEEAPCSNCVRHGVACSLAGGPNVPREDAIRRASSATPSSTASRTRSYETRGAAAAATAVRASNYSSPSPFTVLTGLIDRPVPGQDHNWQLDLQLLHHFMTHTKQIITECQANDYLVRLWQYEAPKVAFAWDYLMHALLGFSALHKAYLEPDSASTLRASAVDHLDKALVLYRQDTGISSEDNANARFLFTWLVALFAFAIPPSVPPIDAIGEVVVLVKGIDTILADTWYWISKGDFAPLLAQMHRANAWNLQIPSLPDGMEFGINHLDYILDTNTITTDDRRVCALVLADLKQTYDLVQRQQITGGMAQILSFPKQEPSAFSKLLKQRLPQALVILAHFCVLMDLLDTRWWIHGWARRIMQDIQTALEDSWRHWIEWPVQVVLMKERTASGALNISG